MAKVRRTAVAAPAAGPAAGPAEGDAKKMTYSGGRAYPKRKKVVFSGLVLLFGTACNLLDFGHLAELGPRGASCSSCPSTL